MTEKQQKTFSVRAMTKRDLPTVLKWRNDPQIRSVMFSKHIISEVEHELWFDKVKKCSNNRVLIFLSDSQRMGFVQFKWSCEEELYRWGFYIAPDAPKGTGKVLGQTAINFFYRELGCDILYACILRSNEVSINFHKRLGFTETNDRKQIFEMVTVSNFIQVALTRHAWEQWQGEIC